MSTVNFTNTLNFSVTVCDSFSDQDTSNYFGTLTPLATVTANTTAPVQLIHRVSALIVSNTTTNVPLARLIFSPLGSTTPFGVGPADVQAMAQTMAFITFITQQPTDPLTTAFQTLWKDSSKPLGKSVNQFFAQHPTYGNCTLATYMMGITYAAEHPDSKGKPLDQAVYSLSTLVKLLGGSWPDGFPDIAVSKFICDTANDKLAIRVEIDLDKLPAQSDQALKFFGSLFNVQKLLVTVTLNYAVGLNMLGTRLAIGLDAIHIPFGGSASLTINKPTATIDINPLFKFVVFTVMGSIPFNIFGKAFEADASMLVDNLEAAVGVVIKGDNTSLPGPPAMQGVHFDEFGVNIGLFFEPPGDALGLSGKFHIGTPGSGSQVALDDDTFAVVCQVVDDVPNPLYVSFYVPQMHLMDVLTVFTNTKTPLDVPVSFTDLSFKWSENPMEPVALPDGSLSSMGYGFSAAANILAFSFYGDVEIDLNNGLTADIEMAPLALGSLFSMGGDGTGVSIKVDASGNPIKNNQLPTTAAQQQALKSATMKQLVAPGGPVLKLQTLAAPFLHVNGHVSLFEVDKAALTAVITTTGITFEVDFGELLTTVMSCALVNPNNLAAAFQFGINQNISLPSIAGVSLGSILLQTTASAHFNLSTSPSDVILQVGGNFNFEGLNRSLGEFTVDAHIQKITELLSAIINFIEQEAKSLFNDLLATGLDWAAKVKQGAIAAIDPVASVLKNAYGQTADQVASTMDAAGYGINEIAGELKHVFDPTQVASTLKDVFGYSANQVAATMQQVGYAGDEVAQALKGAFGNNAGEIASALKDAYGWSADQINGALGNIGFTPDQIGQAFQSLGGDFAKAGTTILDGLSDLGNKLNPANWFP
ncbi:hypothetical protein DPSP01_014483 [Paraphaeosphaeria sporulosa]